MFVLRILFTLASTLYALVSAIIITESPMKPVSNYLLVPDWLNGGNPICTLCLLFISKIDSPLSLIEASLGFSVQFNGSGRAELGMSLPNFAEEELDLRIAAC